MMDAFHNMPDDVEAVPFSTEAPMNTQMSQETLHERRMPDSKALCAHQRLIDDVRTRSGKPTGKVRCLECGTIFNDPYKSMNGLLV